MTSINWGQVLLGGLLAGLVMNVSEAALRGGYVAPIRSRSFASMASLILHNRLSVSLIVMTFVLGIASVWLYRVALASGGSGDRGLRRSGGLGNRTCGLGSISGQALPGLIPAKLALLPVAWGLVEAPLGTVAGRGCAK